MYRLTLHPGPHDIVCCFCCRVRLKKARHWVVASWGPTDDRHLKKMAQLLCRPLKERKKTSKSPVEVGSLSHYWHDFIYPRWLFGISSINNKWGIALLSVNNMISLNRFLPTNKAQLTHLKKHILTRLRNAGTLLDRRELLSLNKYGIVETSLSKLDLFFKRWCTNLLCLYHVICSCKSMTTAKLF